MGRYSEAAQDTISGKMYLTKSENKPQGQKVAVAIDEARKAGFKVPKVKRTTSLAEKAKRSYA